MFEKFRAYEANRLAPVRVEHREPVLPAPPTAKTIRMTELFREMETDSGARIRSAKAWLEIKTDGLWEDSFSSFRQCCGNRLMQVHWIEEMIATIPIYEGLTPASRAILTSNDELVQLSKFKKSDRNSIVAKAAERNLCDGSQAATRITDAAAKLGLKAEVKP